MIKSVSGHANKWQTQDTNNKNIFNQLDVNNNLYYIQLPNKKCYSYCEMLWFPFFPFLSSGRRKKKCLLAINSFSDSPSLHSRVSKAPTMQAAEIVQWAMCTGSLSPCSEVIKGEVKNCLMSSELQTLQWVHFTLRLLHVHHPQPSTCLWNIRETQSICLFRQLTQVS